MIHRFALARVARLFHLLQEAQSRTVPRTAVKRRIFSWRNSTRLLEPQFLARLEQLELVSRKIFLGRHEGRAAQQAQGAERRVRRLSQLRHRRRSALPRLEPLRPPRSAVHPPVHGRRRPALLRAHRQQPVDGLRQADQAALRQAGRRGAGLHRPGQHGSRRHRGVQRPTDAEHAGRARPQKPVAPARFPGQDRSRPAPATCAKSLRNFSVKSSGKGIVVLLSDFMDKGGYEEALRYLVARQIDVYVIQILSQEEIEPEIVGDLKLVDVEDDDEAEITVSGPLLKRYKQNLAAFRGSLHEFCTRRGVTCLFTSNQVPFDRLVLTYLRQRGLVR